MSAATGVAEQPSATRRVALVGDVGGHAGPLRAELQRLGAAADGRLPPDLRVVQVGDLVHRGPDSEEVIALVDRYLRTQPDQWIQLVGNHEVQYLREPTFDWPTRIGSAAAATLRRWWSHGDMRAAHAFTTADGEHFLVTHAGLTVGFWTAALDAPTDAQLAARAINSFIGRHEDALFHAGHMLGGGAGRPDAGPVWASAGEELLPGWETVPMPFSQIHGHTSVVDWTRNVRRASGTLADRISVDEQARHAIVTMDGGRFIGIDPGHGREPAQQWHALVLTEMNP